MCTVFYGMLIVLRTVSVRYLRRTAVATLNIEAAARTQLFQITIPTAFPILKNPCDIGTARQIPPHRDSRKYCVQSRSFFYYWHAIIFLIRYCPYYPAVSKIPVSVLMGINNR